MIQKTNFYYLTSIIVCLVFAVPAFAWDIAVEVDRSQHSISIYDYRTDMLGNESHIELNKKITDIQAIRIQRNSTDYIVVATKRKRKIDLAMYTVNGERIASKKIFLLRDTKKTFSSLFAEIRTIDNQEVIQARAIIQQNHQPIFLRTKRITIDPTAETVFHIVGYKKKDITYPSNLSVLENEKAGMALLNYERLSAGLMPVRRNSELDSGCELHAEYMRLNDTMTHSEDTSKSGYSEEGNTAGQNSNLGIRSTTAMTDSIFSWTTAIYHRLPMIDHDLRKIGWAISSQSASGQYYACLNMYSAVYPSSYGGDLNVTYYDPNTYAPIPYPGVFQQHVPTTFSGGENPDPIADFGGSYPVGQPISLSFPTNDDITDASMTVSDEQGNILSGYFRAPNDSSDSNSVYQKNALTFIATQPLQAQTTYTVQVNAQRNEKSFNKTWKFTTE